MLKVLFGAFLAGAAFVGWNLWNAAIGDLSATEARAVMSALEQGWGQQKAELHEPVLKATDEAGWFVCGWVRMGGASAPLGSQPFVGILFSRGEFRIATLAVTRGERNAVLEVCRLRGLVL
jgi:hypothetical protein